LKGISPLLGPILTVLALVDGHQYQPRSGNPLVTLERVRFSG
jgi:hypothetical protein